jgi:hypothetical protein
MKKPFSYTRPSTRLVKRKNGAPKLIRVKAHSNKLNIWAKPKKR